MKKIARKHINRETQISLIFIIPALILYIIFTIIPSTYSLLTSFTDWDGISKHFNFTGIGNYIEILSENRFLSSIKNTFLIMVINVIIVNFAAIFLALLLDKIKLFKNFYRSIFFVPQVLSAMVISFIWSYVLNYTGIFNTLLGKMGLNFLIKDWIGDPKLAIFTFTFILIWQGIGFYMVIYLASLQTIPYELIEASKIDGAGQISRFKNIIWPLLSTAVTTCVVLSTIWSLNVFDMVIALTGGGPGFSTETAVVTMVFESTRSNRQGIAAAEAVVLLIIISFISLYLTKILRKREVEY
jgi:raffinose/stachyose/melibiose transport system permease protein